METVKASAINISAENQRSLQDIDEMLSLAKLDQNEFVSTSQVLCFTPHNLHNHNYRFLELDNHLSQEILEGATLHIKGKENENAVLCTNSRTYNVVEAETSNSLLLVDNLKFKSNLNDEKDRTVSKVTVSGIFYDYLEVVLGKPHLKKLHDILQEAPYKGPECENEVNQSNLFTFEDLLDKVQASKEELTTALESMRVLKVDEKIRILDFEYLFRVLSHMLKLIDENSWPLDEIDFDETVNSLSEFIPYEILNSVFDIYTEESKIVDGLQLYRYKEVEVCKFYAQVLLHNAGKFNFNDFMQAWKESVPEGMVPQIEMLYGVAIIDQKSTPKVIRALAEDSLPENIVERFKVLFDVKEKWTVPEIAPYIWQLATDKTDVNALLAKYARASTTNNVKYYSGKHAK